MNRSSSPRRFLRVAEAAHLLDTSPAALRARIRREEFPTGIVLRYGKRAFRFHEAKLLLWLESRAVKGGAL